MNIVGSGSSSSSTSKRKMRQYSEEYLGYGFIPSFTNASLPMCLLCEKTFANDAMKPSKMKDHQERMHADSLDYDLGYFLTLKEQARNRLMENIFPLTAASHFNNMVLNTFYYINTFMLFLAQYEPIKHQSVNN